LIVGDLTLFGPYSAVLRTPGARAFSGTGLVARLPMSMFGLGIVLSITGSGGSYTQAGFAAGAALVGQAIGSPLQARVADRIGQRRMLIPLLVAHGVALGGLILVVGDAAAGEIPYPVLVVVAVLSGLTLPQIGALVRARWAWLHSATPRLHTAYAWESVLDEVVFVVGPILVVALATGLHPAAGLVAILGLGVVGGFVFASLRATEPRIRRHSGPAVRERLPAATLAWIVAAFVFMGAIFGSVEVTTVAFTEALGAPSMAGPVLAVFAGGSLVAGLVAGAIHWKSRPRRRFLVGQAALGAAVLPLSFVGTVPLLFLAVFIAGFAISPTLITGFSMIEAEVPASRLTEGLAWVSTALSVGVAAGAAVVGPVIDQVGPSEAYLVAFVCGVLATLACFVGVTADRRGGLARPPAAVTMGDS
jgi:MFS family permease